MSETADLTRDVRLTRLQLDALVGRLSGQDARFSGVEGRLASLEQSFHDLANETARGFGQVQQQLTRQEKWLDSVDVTLAAIRTELGESSAAILAAIAAGRGE